MKSIIKEINKEYLLVESLLNKLLEFTLLETVLAKQAFLKCVSQSVE